MDVGCASAPRLARGRCGRCGRAPCSPCGRTSSSNESISSGCPTISKTIASAPRSATRASKACASAISSPRFDGRRGHLEQRELTLDRLVRLELAHAQDVDELVHLLLDLLERMLVAVDAERDARDVVPLGRPDRQALDVEPAAREHARDAHERARLVLHEHRQRVPHAGLDTAFTPRWRGLRLLVLDEVERGGAGGDHREAVLARVDPRVDDGRAAAGDCLLERALELVLVVDGQADGAVRLGEPGVVGHVVRQVDLREPLVEEHVLPLADHAEVAVVDDHDHDRQVLEHGRRELLAGHLEAAVAVDADDRRLRPRSLRADSGGHAVAHRAQSARGDERARAIAEQVLHRPHLVLADAGRPDDVARRR